MKSVILNLLSFLQVLKREALQTLVYTREGKEEKKTKNSMARPKEKPVERKRQDKATQFQILIS